MAFPGVRDLNDVPVLDEAALTAPKMKDLPKEMGGLGETLPSSPLRGGMTAH
jgi:hypothetical protein